ncbi:ABC transporter ATP-binding protein [Photobacterium aquimaris]|uniref:ABC transporter ATP-binding protein n=1 Tax=Photobacterium aquimaris TaxID=512643 RepID=UPI00138F9EC7|nr:ABC transporter ATP-binding protein [Photobacterium aquimaris]
MKELFLILNKKERKSFLIIQLLIVVMALLEMVSIMSIGPFLSLITNKSDGLNNSLIMYFYEITHSESWNDFILKCGLIILSLFFTSMAISIVTTWKMSTFGSKLGANIGTRLYNHYLHSNWNFHLLHSNSYLSKQIATESTRLSHAVIAPILQVNSKLIILLILFLAVFIKNPIGAILFVLVFLSIYFFIFKMSKNILSTNGRRVTTIMEERFKLLNDGFGIIKEIILLGCQSKFIKDFQVNGENLAKAQAENQAISLIPKYIIEFFAYSGIIIYSLYLFNLSSTESGVDLANLIVYIFLGFKALPNIQQLYGNISVVKGNISSFYSISKDLKESQNKMLCDTSQDEKKVTGSFNIICFDSVNYRYPNKDKFAINKLSLRFERNKTYGIVGHSGSGKSTLIDLILGLIIPDDGIITMNNQRHDVKGSHDWMKRIGLVQQDIKLINATLAENIALGHSFDEINMERLNDVIKLSNLNDMIDNHDDGINMIVGERGINLSGGQKQRISIARALYNDPEILVFDEATSALDGLSEKKIMASINKISKSKTIIMVAHRLKTVENCDMIYMLEHGFLVDSGTFKTLQKNNNKFSKMVENS